MLDLNSTANKARHLVELINAAAVTASAQRPSRDYLGLSMAGERCERKLQLEFEGAEPDEPFRGETLRIFERGHRMEDMAAEWLRAAGFDLKTAKPDGSQFGVEDCEGRIQGHIDGVIIAGPDLYAYPALWENKALGDKGFKGVAKNGVAKAYPGYHAQVCAYQGYMKLAENPAIFTAINANTMELYVELVPFDASLAQASIDRLLRVVEGSTAGETLPRIAATPDNFACKWCRFNSSCWREPRHDRQPAG